MLNETIKCMFHLTLVLFQLIDILHNPKIQQLWALLSDRNGFDDVFCFIFSRLSKQRIQIAQVKTEKPHGKINLKENRRVRAPAFSPWRNTCNIILFRNGSRNGGPVPRRGLKPRGLGESLREGSRSSSDSSWQPWLGVSPELPTGLPGMEGVGQWIQKAPGQNQRGVLISC